MNVVIIGDPKKTGERIKAVATELTQSGITVRYPAENGLNTSDDVSMIETFGRIDWANWVIAIPREGLTLDPSTSAEMAYAKHIHKPVLIYYE